ncbi:hypothetical protein QWZ13_06290 [Reinekea marina]|nr:hypothetical protein [Reinekea marina]MDN3648517.1 hypothetical protein [Reinekea marina]
MPCEFPQTAILRIYIYARNYSLIVKPCNYFNKNQLQQLLNLLN